MKKAFEIWIDDDAELSSFCGTVVSETEVKKGVTSICLSKAEIEGKAGYLFPIEGPGSFVILLEDDEDEKEQTDISPSNDYRNSKCKDCKHLYITKETVSATGRVIGRGECHCVDVLNHPTMRQRRVYSDRACSYFKKKD